MTVSNFGSDDDFTGDYDAGGDEVSNDLNDDDDLDEYDINDHGDSHGGSYDSAKNNTSGVYNVHDNDNNVHSYKYIGDNFGEYMVGGDSILSDSDEIDHNAVAVMVGYALDE